MLSALWLIGNALDMRSTPDLVSRALNLVHVGVPCPRSLTWRRTTSLTTPKHAFKVA